jgi:hypothetical protein
MPETVVKPITQGYGMKTRFMRAHLTPQHLKPYIQKGDSIRFESITSQGEKLCGIASVISIGEEKEGEINSFIVSALSLNVTDVYGHAVGKTRINFNIPYHYTPLLVEKSDPLSLTIRAGEELITFFRKNGPAA